MRNAGMRVATFLVIVSLLGCLGADSSPAFASERGLWGWTRFETAVSISQDQWTSSEWVVIATGMDFPDGLAGAPLAHVLGAPLLLTSGTRLEPVVASEVTRLGARRAKVLGGRRALSDAVIDGLVAAGIPRANIERISGTDRYETARAIAARMQSISGLPSGAVVANGRRFPDALAAAGYAARSNRPILLTETYHLPPATRQALDAIPSGNTVIVGGTSAVSNGVASLIPGAQRIGGRDRYHTAVLIAERAQQEGVLGFNELVIATGEQFPDALAAGPYVAARQSSLILVGWRTVPQAVDDFLRAHARSIDSVVFLGGTGAICTEARAGVNLKLHMYRSDFLNTHAWKQ